MPTRTLVHAPRNVEHIPPKPHPHPEHMQAHHDGTAQTPPLLMQRAHQSPAQLGATDIAYLQRTVGNHAVDHLLHPQQPSTLKVGPAHDPFEAQADTVARSVAGAPVQRAVAGGSAPMGREGGALDGATAQTIRHAQRGGQPIPDPVRAPVEQALHADLSHARLHVGAQADDLSQRMGARAFTTGRDIFVQRSEYRPDSRAGRSLLYHELTHVQQQTGAGPGASPTAVQGSSAGGVVQRALTEKAGAISALWKSKYTTYDDEGKAALAQSEQYLAGFDTPATEPTARANQVAEEEQMHKVLHFGFKQRWGNTKDRRVWIRAILTAQRARHQPIAVLNEFKQFLIDYSKIIPEKDLQSFLNGYQNTIDSILKQATAWGASDDLLNLIYTSAPSYVKAFDRRFKQYPGRVDKLSTDALEVASTSDKPEVQEQLRSQVAQMKDLAANATNLYRQGDYLQAANVVGELEPIFNAVWKLTNYEKMSATAKLSSAKEVGPAKELGGGEFSKVYEVNYDPAKNPSIQHGVFKQEQRDYSGKDSAGASESGIPELNANFGGRSVATYKVDKLLKLGMTPKTKFGTHEGEIGTVQGWAKGKAPQKKGDDEEGPETLFREFNYDDPEIQRQLSTLQIFDAITGQVDRHPGNYYIYQGPDGTKVTAIDNDLAFGANKDVGLMMIKDSFGKTVSLPNDQGRGVPLFVDESIADTILNTQDQDLKDTIVHLLSPQEIDKTMVRFNKVKAELRRMKSNTAELKRLQQELDLMTGLQGRFAGREAGMADAVGLQIDQIRKDMAATFARGALIDQSAWGAQTAQHLNMENSYYGALLGFYQMHKERGNMVPND